MQSVVCQTCNYEVVASDRFCTHCGAGLQPSLRESENDISREQVLVESLRRATLGEYEIREELGRGGMAMVYLAHELRLNKKVALKVLSPHLQMMPGMAARFLREAQTAAGMEHPNIIPIYAYRETADFAFFTMRYVEGASLSGVAKQVGQFPIATARALLWDIGGGLAYAHAHGVLHRDVKPGNVLLGRDGSVVVTDFGIAKQADGHAITMTGQLLGTPSYMSPEQCRGSDVSFASDQYSLGVMAFELLAGRVPFKSDGVGELMAQHLMEPPPQLRKFRPDCPRDLADAVMRMLAKDPRARFASIEEALIAARATPVLPHDPARVQLRTWAANPAHAHNLANTPVSPIVGLPKVAAAAAPVPAAPHIDSATQAPQHILALQRTASGARNRWLLPTLGAIGAIVAVVVILKSTEESVPPPPTMGTLQVTELPAGGAMFVDGAKVDGGSIKLNAGDHRLRLDAPGYAVTDTVVQLVAGDIASIRFAAARIKLPPTPPPPSKGALAITGLPVGGSIRIDGRRVSGSRAELDEGQHTVLLQAPGYEPVENVVQIGAGQTRALVFDSKRVAALPPKLPDPTGGTGVLMLRVRPFAKVFVDGQLVVEDERLITTLSEGRHLLRFEKAGFATLDTAVIVPRADTLKQLFTLKSRTP